MADPVQSVGIGAALARRYCALAKEAESADADLGIAIGEGQQIYPEMWRHLDEARIVLGERGVDCNAYDDLRRQELRRLGVDVDFSVGVELYTRFGMKVGELYKKTATFDIGGAQRALAAAVILRQLMPDVDWRARAQDEERLIREAGSLKSATWIGLAKIAGAGAAIAILALVAFNSLSSAGRDAESNAVRPVSHVEQNKPVVAPPDPVKLAARPQCDKSRQRIAERIAKEHDLVRGPQWSMDCQGILIDNQPVALAVSVHAPSRGGALTELRGVVSLDGMHDLKAFVAVPPGTTLAFVGDLDRDTSDELVFVGQKSLVISRLTKDGFSDVQGPPLAEGCSADAKVSGDYRNGREGLQNVLVLTVPDEQTGSNCMSAGKHYYKLDGDKLVEF